MFSPVNLSRTSTPSAEIRSSSEAPAVTAAWPELRMMPYAGLMIEREASADLIRQLRRLHAFESRPDEFGVKAGNEAHLLDERTHQRLARPGPERELWIVTPRSGLARTLPEVLGQRKVDIVVTDPNRAALTIESELRGSLTHLASRLNEVSDPARESKRPFQVGAHAMDFAEAPQVTTRVVGADAHFYDVLPGADPEETRPMFDEDVVGLLSSPARPRLAHGRHIAFKDTCTHAARAYRSALAFEVAGTRALHAAHALDSLNAMSFQLHQSYTARMEAIEDLGEKWVPPLPVRAPAPRPRTVTEDQRVAAGRIGKPMPRPAQEPLDSRTLNEQFYEMWRQDPQQMDRADSYGCGW